MLDDADDASPAVLEAAAALAANRASPPCSCSCSTGTSRARRRSPSGGAAAPALAPLRVDAAAEIAELYAPADGVAMPLETLMAESDGVPLRVHRAASGWAQAQAAERLEATVGRAASERGGLRAAEAEVAGSVADLQVARERTSLYLVAEPPDPSAPEVCPFRGLAPFDAAHAEYFFGRERLVADLVARLVGSTLIAVVGPSGSGKSSVLRAGLLPALADGVLPGSERWRQVLMRPGEHPLAELGRALARVAPERGRAATATTRSPRRWTRSGPTSAWSSPSISSRRSSPPVATRPSGPPSPRRSSRSPPTPTSASWSCSAIRADFYGRCAEYPELSAQMSANNVLVGPMRRDELRRAIELPARRAGLRVEPSLVSALVGDVADEPGGLPLLSTTLVELWQERSGRTLRQASYAASGGVSGAVARLAERAYRRLSEPQRERARAILLRLADAEEAAPVAGGSRSPSSRPSATRTPPPPSRCSPRAAW